MPPLYLPRIIAYKKRGSHTASLSPSPSALFLARGGRKPYQGAYHASVHRGGEWVGCYHSGAAETPYKAVI